MQVHGRYKTFSRAVVVAGVTAGAVVMASGAASAATVSASRAAAACDSSNALASVHYSVVGAAGGRREFDGIPNVRRGIAENLGGKILPGDTVTITYKVVAGCEGARLSAATYRAPLKTPGPGQDREAFYASQVLFSSDTRVGSGKLTVRVPVVSKPAGDATCTNKHLDSPQTGNGNGSSSPDNPYVSTCNGSPSMNGSGTGAATGEPCAGCVGNADNKNPKGQAPNGTDANAGYECDTNHGVGQSNPAHTGCNTINYQFDFAVGKVLEHLTTALNYHGIVSYATA